MKLINKYLNGNCSVTLYDDGTKIREYENEPCPIMPESIDYKITDFCDAKCSWCHESSTVKGKHASLNSIQASLQDASAGMEVAIGGGDPFSHPDFFSIIAWMRKKGLVSNVTVNARHVRRYKDKIAKARQAGVYGIGISWHKPFEQDILNVIDNRTVLHFIAGVDNINDAIRLAKSGVKRFLVLGYKSYGRGELFYSKEVSKNINKWRYWIGKLMKSGAIISFDNLGIKQLNVKQWINESMWNERYMGDDGRFTMYVDAVTDSFAKTSTCERVNRGDKTLKEMFEVVREI